MVTGAALRRVVYDEPILRYLVRRSYPGLEVLPGTFERQDYAIALPQGSELREPVDLALLATIDEPGWQDVLEGYLGN